MSRKCSMDSYKMINLLNRTTTQKITKQKGLSPINVFSKGTQSVVLDNKL